MRVAYLDLDGTLTLEGSMFHAADGLSLDGARALHRLLDAGYEIVPTSGRTVPQLREIARLFGSRTFIAELGSVVAYEGGKKRAPVSGSGLTADGLRKQGLADRVFDAFDDLEWHTPWSENREYTLLLRGRADAHELDRFVRDLDANLRAVDNGEIGGGVHAYHVLPRDVGKGYAITRDMETRGLAPEDCVAFGDSAGDLEMAEQVGRYVWVGGARGDLGPIVSAENVVATTARYGEGLLEGVKQLLG